MRASFDRFPSWFGSHWVKTVARIGYSARGVIYVRAGFLALLSALGRKESEAGSSGALETLMHSPGGWIVLLLIGIGLLCLAVWRGVQAIADVDGYGTRANGLAVRGGLLVAAVVCAGLGAWSIARAMGYASSSAASDGGGQSWIAWALAQPFGRWAMAGIGIAIVGTGVAQIVKGWRARFRKRLMASDALLRKLMPIGRIGLMAHGTAFGIIGALLVAAAWNYDPKEAGGMLAWDGAQVIRQPAMPTTVVDRLGAGDALAAGVIHGWLDGDFPLGLRCGAALAALALRRHGDMIICSDRELRALIESTDERPAR
jgi:hypothetical protein